MSRSLLFTVAAVVLFVVAFLVALNALGGNFDALVAAGLASGFAAQLP